MDQKSKISNLALCEQSESVRSGFKESNLLHLHEGTSKFFEYQELKIKTAKQCLQLFLDHLKTEKLSDLSTPEEVGEMDIHQIKSVAKITYMKYILTQSYSAPINTITTLAYKHLITIIDDASCEYDVNNGADVTNKELIERDIKQATKSKKKGWFY